MDRTSSQGLVARLIPATLLGPVLAGCTTVVQPDMERLYAATWENADQTPGIVERFSRLHDIGIAEGHYEKYDGSGYPHGLAGERIPLAACLVAAADVFDALTSKRPYKESWPLVAAGQRPGRSPAASADRHSRLAINRRPRPRASPAPPPAGAPP